jgi:hypothetical protein
VTAPAPGLAMSTPPKATSSSFGFSLGSALGGLILATGTSAGHPFPADGAYPTAAWTGTALMALATAATLIR